MPRKPTGIPGQTPPFDSKVGNEPQLDAIKPPQVRQNPAFSVFQVGVRFSLDRGEGAIEAALPPAGIDGQQAVIEHVTIAASVPRSQGIVAYIKIGEIEHALVMTPQEGWSNPKRLRASQPIKLYSLGGGDGMAMAGVERSHTTGSASFYFTISGYLVTLP